MAEDIKERAEKLKKGIAVKTKINQLRKRLESDETVRAENILANDGSSRATNSVKEEKADKRIDDLSQRAHIQELKRSAIIFDSEQKYYLDAEVLLKEIAEASFEYGKPILSSWNGKEFVVEANSTHRKACETWVDQSYGFNKDSYETLKQLATGDFLTNTPSKSVLYESQDRKIAEAILVNYPEKAGILDTIQLHGVYLSNFGNEKSFKAEHLLRASITEYMSGKETFKPNIYNVAQLDELKEFAFKSGMYSLEDLDKRMDETRKDMLATLDDRKLKYLSDDALLFVSQIAQKYPENETAKKVKETSQGIMSLRDKEKSKNR